MDKVLLPSDFVKKMKELLGEEWQAFEDSYRKPEYQALRFNALKKGKSNSYAFAAEKMGIDLSKHVEWADDAYYYGEPLHPGRHPFHEMGLYYIQEPSAMAPAALLRPKPGERVLDLCAAPGGKAAQLASYLKGEGMLVANEIHPERCRILSQNMERMGISNVVVTNETCERLADCFPAYFHKVLVDAPCSGEGMFHKNPDSVLEWSSDQVLVCAQRQKMILTEAARMLMPGGRMVYSTCTFSPEENEGVIREFLLTHPDFELVQMEAAYFDQGRPEWADGYEELARCFRLFPHHLRGEGHFAAVLKRRGGEVAYGTERQKKKHMPLSKQQLAQLLDFTSGVLTKECEDFVLSGNLCLFGDQLYRLPDDAPVLSGIRVLRPGLHIGTFKKNRLEPAHAFALFLGIEDVKNVLQLCDDIPLVDAYFRGETIQAEGKKGFCLVSVDGYSAGWGKIAGGQMKNHYPKGLRKDLHSYQSKY